MSPTAPAITDESAASRSRRDTPGRIRRDLRFLRLYVYTVPRTLRYPALATDAQQAVTPVENVARIENGLAAEARRFRRCGWAIVALIVTLPLLAAFLWSGMWWVPVRVYWWPFERGNYGLPFFSLFEWLCYLVLAAYFVVTFGLLSDGYVQTRCLGAEYRRLLSADDATRGQIVRVMREGASPRAEFVVRRAPVFLAYREALDRDGCS